MVTRRRGVLPVAGLVGLTLVVSGCAASSGGPGAENYATDQVLNARAQLAADPVDAELQDDPTYGGVQIVPRGLEIDVVGSASAAVELAVERASRRVPVQTRAVRHSWVALQALTTRLGADQKAWRAKGVLLSMWGPDVDTNRVEVWLSTYSGPAARALTTTYGADWLLVSTRPESGSGS